MAGAIMDKVWGLFGGVDQEETEEYDNEDIYDPSLTMKSFERNKSD